MKTDIGVICSSWDIFQTHWSFSFGFDLKDNQGSKIKAVFKIHVTRLRRRKLHSRYSKTEVCSCWRWNWLLHRRALNATLYNHVYSSRFFFFFRQGAKCQNQMLHAIKWPQTSAISRILFENSSSKLRYCYSKFQFYLIHSATRSLSRVTKLSRIQGQDICYVSWKFQRNGPSGCCDTALWT